MTWLIAAQHPTTAAADLAALARRLGAPTAEDQADAIEHLFDALRESDRWLLIYDNAEHPRRCGACYRRVAGGTCW